MARRLIFLDTEMEDNHSSTVINALCSSAGLMFQVNYQDIASYYEVLDFLQVNEETIALRSQPGLSY